MQATHIHPGQEYALSTQPRKGIDDLVSIPARRVRVRTTGVQRFNPTGGEFQEGTYKNDGIKVAEWDGAIFVDSGEVYKARDFLMPWHEYDNEKKIRAAAREKRAQEIAVQQELHKDRVEALRAEMVGYDMRHTENSAYLGTSDPADGHTRDFVIADNSRHVIVHIDAMERLMASMAERIYEAMRDAG